MVRVLLTAFEPYEAWSANASWLALAELLRDLETPLEVTTRLYPVRLDAMQEKLAVDMKSRFDYAIHCGQAPGSAAIQLEEFALNVTPAAPSTAGTASLPIDDSGPAAYRSQLPLKGFARAMREAGIPARVSQHAGTYLCNATLYWSHRLIHDLDLPTQAAFVHVPLETSQVLQLDSPTAFMPKEMVAKGIKILLQLLENDTSTV